MCTVRHPLHRTVAVLVLTTVLLSGLTVTARADRSPKKHNPIYIGQIVALTGINAPYPNGPTRYQLAAARLAVRQINAQGGVKGRLLKLVVVDDRSMSSGAISAMRTLTASRRISAIIGPNFSAEIQALHPYIERAGIPMIIGGQVPATTRAGDPWVFRTRPTQLVEERVLPRFTVGTLHLTKVAIIHTSGITGEQAASMLRTNLEMLGVTPVTVQSLPNQASDAASQVLAIKRSGAVALISVFAEISDYLLIARQMHQIGVHVIWLGNPVLSVEPARRQGGTLFYGAYAVTDFAPGQSREAVAFNRELEATYHLPGVIGNAYVYDGVQILARVMRQAGTSAHAIRRGILATQGYRGVEGTYHFDKNGDGLHQETIVQNAQGRLRVVKVVTG